MKKDTVLLIKNGKKILLEQNYGKERNNYTLPTIKRSSQNNVENDIKDQIKTKYNLEIIIAKQIFSDDESVWL